jgi:hypothetical protein
MMARPDNEFVAQHLREVGLVCSQWAYLEWLFEVLLFWLIGFHNKPVEGRIATGAPGLETTSKRVCELAHLRLTDIDDMKLLESVRDRIKAVVDERNLAVHGVRSALSAETVVGRVARGPYKNKPQQLPPVRLASLNVELKSITDSVSPLLVRNGIIEY